MFDPDELNLKRGGGCFLAVFGTPFFLAGLGVIVLGLSGAMKSDDGSQAPLLMLIPFGLLFASVGGALMFGRAGVRLNRREKSVKRWWGTVFFPLWSKTYPFDHFNVVTIVKEERRGKNSTYTVYPVRLSGEGEKIKVSEPGDYERARAMAEKTAKFLDLGIRDAGRGETVIREAWIFIRIRAERTRASNEKEGRNRDEKREHRASSCGSLLRGLVWLRDGRALSHAHIFFASLRLCGFARDRTSGTMVHTICLGRGRPPRWQ